MAQKEGCPRDTSGQRLVKRLCHALTKGNLALCNIGASVCLRTDAGQVEGSLQVALNNKTCRNYLVPEFLHQKQRPSFSNRERLHQVANVRSLDKGNAKEEHRGLIQSHITAEVRWDIFPEPLDDVKVVCHVRGEDATHDDPSEQGLFLKCPCVKHWSECRT